MSTGSSFNPAWFSSLSSERICVFSVHAAVYIEKFLLLLYFSFYSEQSVTVVAQCHDTVGWVI